MMVQPCKNLDSISYKKKKTHTHAHSCDQALIITKKLQLILKQKHNGFICSSFFSLVYVLRITHSKKKKKESAFSADTQ